MSEINITIEGGKSKRLLTAGKYCNDNIVVTATDSDNYELYGTYVLSMTPEIPYETYFEFNLNAEAFFIDAVSGNWIKESINYIEFAPDGYITIESVNGNHTTWSNNQGAWLNTDDVIYQEAGDDERYRCIEILERVAMPANDYEAFIQMCDGTSAYGIGYDIGNSEAGGIVLPRAEGTLF